MSRVLVFGARGQVSKELASTGNVTCIGRAEANLEDPATCSDAIKRHAPTAVINAAAYTALDKAEKEEAVAEVVNAHAVEAMAETCAEMDILLVHISTDYVFKGAGLDAFNSGSSKVSMRTTSVISATRYLQDVYRYVHKVLRF